MESGDQTGSESWKPGGDANSAPVFIYPLAMPMNAVWTRFAPACIVAAFASLSPAQASVWNDSLSLFRYTQPVLMTLLLPPDGPGSSLTNPARLADGERFYAQLGNRKPGNAEGFDVSLGEGFGRRFYLGAFLSGGGGTFAGTNEVIIDNQFGFQAAYRGSLDAEGKGHFSIGLTDTYRQVNLMGTYKAIRFTPDLGLILVPSSYPGGWKLEFGWAMRDLRDFEATAPRPVSDPQDPYRETHVDFAPWLTTGSIIASSPARTWSLNAEAAAGALYEPAYHDTHLAGWDAGVARLYIPRIGATYRPVAPVSVGVERVWGRYWSLHTTLGTGEWFRIHCEADFRAAYGPYLQYQYPDRTDWTLGWNLRIIM